MNGLNALGFDVKCPRGIFYVWFNSKSRISIEFNERMLDLDIVVTTGSGFGESINLCKNDRHITNFKN